MSCASLPSKYLPLIILPRRVSIKRQSHKRFIWTLGKAMVCTFNLESLYGERSQIRRWAIIVYSIVLVFGGFMVMLSPEAEHICESGLDGLGYFLMENQPLSRVFSDSDHRVDFPLGIITTVVIDSFQSLQAHLVLRRILSCFISPCLIRMKITSLCLI